MHTNHPQKMPEVKREPEAEKAEEIEENAEPEKAEEQLGEVLPVE